MNSNLLLEKSKNQVVAVKDCKKKMKIREGKNFSNFIIFGKTLLLKLQNKHIFLHKFVAATGRASAIISAEEYVDKVYRSSILC